jgi:serine/threonine-protein phosphatase 5
MVMTKEESLCVEDFEEVDAEWIEKTTKVLEKASWRSDCSLEKVFPPTVLCKLLRACQKVLHKEPTVLDIEVPEDGHINVVGDTHGQFHDVLALFASAGKPSEKNLFVFNGDFVDRGAWGVEVLSTLLSWKVRRREKTNTVAFSFSLFFRYVTNTKLYV